MTQPLMYERIGNRDSVRQKYTDELIGRGDLSEEDAEAAARDFRDQMESVFNEVKEAEKNGPQEQTGIAASQELTRGLDTSISADTLRELGEACLLYTSPSPRDVEESRMPSSA